MIEKLCGFATSVDWVAAFTFALVVATILLYTVTLKAAKAAEKSAEIADSALKTTQRAYMSATDWSMRDLKSGNRLRVSFVARNTGVSRAKIICISMNALADELPDSPTYEDASYALQGATIDPGRGMKIPRDFTVRASVPIDDILSGSSPFNCWGRITYLDIFDQERRTDFCVTYDHEVGGLVFTGGVMFYSST